MFLKSQYFRQSNITKKNYDISVKVILLPKKIWDKEPKKQMQKQKEGCRFVDANSFQESKNWF